MAYALARVRRPVTRFLSWWMGELRGMVPDRVVRLFSPPVDELVVEPSGGRLMLRRRNGGGERELGVIDVGQLVEGQLVEGQPGASHPDPEPAKAALRSLLAGLDLRRRVIALRVPAERALRKVVDLPAAAEENLREVLAFEMDRLTPFPVDTVYYDVRVLERDAANRRIRAELTVLPRATVDPTVALLRRIGLQPDAIALPRAADSTRPPWRVPLAAESGRRRLARLPLLLLLLAAAFAVTATMLSLDRQQARLQALEREVAAARRDADEGRRLQEEIAKLSGEGNFIVERKQARPPMVEMLNEVTRALPDDTWLYRLRLNDDELQTFGYSPNASALIGLIEGSPLFANAQFRAPLTRDQRIDAEQFHVAFQVRREQEP